MAAAGAASASGKKKARHQASQKAPGIPGHLPCPKAGAMPHPSRRGRRRSEAWSAHKGGKPEEQGRFTRTGQSTMPPPAQVFRRRSAPGASGSMGLAAVFQRFAPGLPPGEEAAFQDEAARAAPARLSISAAQAPVRPPERQAKTSSPSSGRLAVAPDFPAAHCGCPAHGSRRNSAGERISIRWAPAARGALARLFGGDMWRHVSGPCNRADRGFP